MSKKKKKKQKKVEDLCPMCGRECTINNFGSWVTLEKDGKRIKVCLSHKGVKETHEKQEKEREKRDRQKAFESVADGGSQE